MTVDDVMLYGKIYSTAQARMHNQIIVMTASCGACGADIDQDCMGQYGRRHPGSLHGDRRSAAETWRKANRAEYAELREELIRFFVGQIIKQVRDGVVESPQDATKDPEASRLGISQD